MGTLKNVLAPDVIPLIDGGTILAEYFRGLEPTFPNFGINSVNIVESSYLKPGKIEFTLVFENEDIFDDNTSFSSPSGCVTIKCEDIISFTKVDWEIDISADWMYEIKFNKIEAYGQTIGIWFQFSTGNGNVILGVAAKKIKVLNINRNTFD